MTAADGWNPEARIEEAEDGGPWTEDDFLGHRPLFTEKFPSLIVIPSSLGP